MDVSEILTVLLGGGVVATITAILRGWAAFRQGTHEREQVILEDLRRERDEWVMRAEDLKFANRELASQMGQRIVGGGRILEIPVLKKPPPPPPAASKGGPTTAVSLQSEERVVKVVAPVRAESVCPHLFCHPVTDALGTELARICIACDAQVTNEEWVRVGW